jgi:GAF domain-containing protein
MSNNEDDPRLRALIRLARQVTARHDLEDVLVETFRELRTLVAFDGGSIQLIDDDGWITVAACDPPAASDVVEARVPLGNSVAGRVVLTEQAIYVADAHADARPALLATTDWADNVRCYLAVPLLADGRAIGLLRVDDARPNAFDSQDRLLIVMAGVVIAAAIQNARAQARSEAARQRVEALERRLEQLRARLDEAQPTSTLSDVEMQSLLTGLSQELGETSATIEIDEEPRVTL